MTMSKSERGSLGGATRAAILTPARRSEIARKAARTRWDNPTPPPMKASDELRRDAEQIVAEAREVAEGARVLGRRFRRLAVRVERMSRGLLTIANPLDELRAVLARGSRGK